MKQLLLPALAVCGTLLPFSQLQASGPASKSFGGFPAGKTFTFKVTDKSSIKTRGPKLTRNAAIPDGIPNFSKGQNVKFTIGEKGKLNGPGFSITYRDSRGGANFYSNNPSFSSSKGAAATVEKTSNNKPTEATLTFYKVTFSGFIPVTNTVTYELE